MHIPGVLFYPISIIGIYFVLSLSDLSERIRPLAKILAFLGRHSFDIMAIHFTLFKLIDFALCPLHFEGNTGNAFQLPGLLPL